MSYSTIIAKDIAPWFATYGGTLTDATSFRHMIALAQRERAGLDKLRADVVDIFPDVAANVQTEIVAADDLIKNMQDRLAAILAEPRPCAC